MATVENAQSGNSSRWGGWREGPELRKRIIAGALLIAALFTVIQAIDYRQDVPSNDTYQYARQTLRVLGDTQAQAVHGAVVMFCQDSGNSAARSATLDYGSGTSGSAYQSGYQHCLQTYKNGLTPSSPRYIAIFTSRPGYPLLTAPFAAAFGLRFGLWITAMLCTLLASFLVLMLLRAAGCTALVALGGQALYLAAPTGYWGSRMLTDGPSLATTMLALLGAWYLMQQRYRLGSTVLVAGFVSGLLIRYSSEEMVALFLALGALVCLRWVPSAKHRGTQLLAAISGAAAVVSVIASTALGWPGISESLQDTFTRHFIRPDVSNPVGRLVNLNLKFWGYFPVSEPTALLLAAGLIAIAIALVRRDPAYGVLVIAVSVTGIATVTTHPLVSQADRLMVPVWLLPVLGLPRLVPFRRPSSAAEVPEQEPAYTAGPA